MKAKDVRNAVDFLTYLDQIGAIYETDGVMDRFGRIKYYVYDKNWYDPDYEGFLPFVYGRQRYMDLPNFRINLPMLEDFNKAHIHELVKKENGETEWIRYFEDVPIETICKKAWRLSRKRKTA